MTKTLALAMLAVTAPAPTLAQAPPLDLLSPHAARPESPPADHGVARAAGMPLRDGALAPGMLTVRIVRGSFDNNVPNQNVTVAIAGGRTETVRTGPDGRAQFAHLPVGASVQAAATVDDEALLSDSFEMPVESGIRLLLVVGDGPVNAAGMPSGPSSVEAAGTPVSTVGEAGVVSVVPAGVAPSSGGESAPSTGITVVRVIMATTTILAFVFVGFRRPRR